MTDRAMGTWGICNRCKSFAAYHGRYGYICSKCRNRLGLKEITVC